MSQTFYFTEPYATTKVRLDEFDGAPEIAFSVEFLGLDRKKRNLLTNPMAGGYMTTSKDLHYLSHNKYLVNMTKNYRGKLISV